MKPDGTRGSRRDFLRATGVIAAGIAFDAATTAVAAAEPAIASASTAAKSSVVSMLEAIQRTVGSATINKGRVKLELPPLVENGNTVGLAVRVDSPMTPADHVRAIHVFSEKNPQPYVVTFRLGPRAGRATVATRVRLADSQTVVAICEMSDGSFWSDSVNVVVTLAACTEEL